ncbi:MAG: hypothetical protein M1541_04310 [Acidobacteria bacterium]|nr:hypothetical protein [Acidobacteriota bacterium]
MKTLICAFCISGLAFAQAKTEAKGTARQLSELEVTKLELLGERLDRLQEKAQPIIAERNKLVKEICTAAGIPVEECQVNMEDKTVFRKPKPAEPKEKDNAAHK